MAINIIRNPQYKFSRTSARWESSSSIRTDRLTDRLEAASSLVIYGEAAPIRGPHFPPTIRTAAFISINVTNRFYCVRGNIQHRWHSSYAYCLHDGVFNDSFWVHSFATVTYCLMEGPCTSYKGADMSLARPTSRCILFDGVNILFDASLVIHTHTHTHTGLLISP